MAVSDRPHAASFAAHLELLDLFLTSRERIVEAVQGLLNAQDKPASYRRDRALLSRQFEDCFFKLPAITPDRLALRGQLLAAHRASGFRPSEIPGLHNDLVDPGEMMVRGFNLWQQTRWPGRNGRVRYAQTLFNLYVLRNLELLSLRLWDADREGAGARLAQLQGVLDRLWKTAPADQPALVRDARWLIPLAQSPANEGLAPYFEVAARVADFLPEADRLEIHKANVELAGGHLRSQLRHYELANGESLTDRSLILRSRRSNALDFAMTIDGLVSLLDAYRRAVQEGDGRRRLELAGAICQGISPDPELFVNRIELLGPCSMVETLMATDRDGQVVRTPTGQRHLRLLQQYASLIDASSQQLYGDCPHFRPVAGGCSPYGVVYGFSYNLLEHMALKALQPDAETRFSLEDVFAAENTGADKLAWVSGWRKLPHLGEEVLQRYAYPQQFAEIIFERIERALRQRATGGAANAAVRTGHLFIAPDDGAAIDPQVSQLPDLPVEYIASSDPQFVAAGKAHAGEAARLLHDRQEGEFLVSYATAGGWVGITKDVLTDVLGAGRDVKLAGLPHAAATVLALMCPELAVAAGAG